MAGLLAFDETTTRKHLGAIYALLLKRSFDGGAEFNHMFMSAGEGLGRSLDYFGAIDWKGSSIFLKMSEQTLLKKIEKTRVDALPLLTDVLNVLLTFIGQYATIPKLINPFETAEFDTATSAILREMKLLDDQQVAQKSLWLFLVDHHSLMPSSQGWNENTYNALREVCDLTLASAPEEFMAVVERRSEHHAVWAEGYMAKYWRHGYWLSAQEKARSFAQDHSFLPHIVLHTLMSASKDIYVPPRFLDAP